MSGNGRNKCSLIYSISGMEESGGKLRGSEDPLHLFNEKAESLGPIHILPAKGLSQEPDMWRTLFTPLAFLPDPYLKARKKQIAFIVSGAFWQFICLSQ